MMESQTPHTHPLVCVCVWRGVDRVVWEGMCSQTQTFDSGVSEILYGQTLALRDWSDMIDRTT